MGIAKNTPRWKKGVICEIPRKLVMGLSSIPRRIQGMGRWCCTPPPHSAPPRFLLSSIFFCNLFDALFHFHQLNDYQVRKRYYAHVFTSSLFLVFRLLKGNSRFYIIPLQTLIFFKSQECWNGTLEEKITAHLIYSGNGPFGLGETSHQPVNCSLFSISVDFFLSCQHIQLRTVLLLSNWSQAFRKMRNRASLHSLPMLWSLTPEMVCHKQ